MKVTVKLFASLGKYLPSGAANNEAAVEATEDSTVAGLLASLGVPEEHCHLVLVNGHYVEPSERANRGLQDGDSLAVWPPVAGG